MIQYLYFAENESKIDICESKCVFVENESKIDLLSIKSVLKLAKLSIENIWGPSFSLYLFLVSIDSFVRVTNDTQNQRLC